MEDDSQRMLNALKPGTVLPIHRHMTTSETVVILRGRAVQYLYDDAGNETGQVLLAAGAGDPHMASLLGLPGDAVRGCRWRRDSGISLSLWRAGL